MVTFKRKLKRHFGRAQVGKILTVLDYLGVEAPETWDDFFLGAEGPLIFLNDVGCVLRIENKKFERIEHPFVLQPLLSVDSGNAIIEICPGMRVMATEQDMTTDFERQALYEDGVRYWDKEARNSGLLPFKTAQFPKGVPVVIDRNAVEMLSSEIVIVQDVVEKKWRQYFGADVLPQDRIYGSLKQAFKEAWPEGQEKPDFAKIKAAWNLCRKAKRNGILFSGWKGTNWDTPSARFKNPEHVDRSEPSSIFERALSLFGL